MKKIGIIGGLSPESTLYYYEKFVEFSRKMFSPSYYPEVVIYSVNFGEFEKVDWDKRTRILVNAATSLAKAGAEIIGIAANTPHKVFPFVKKSVNVKMISIIDVVGKEANRRNLRKLLLLGTKITMEEGFYAAELKKFGIEAITPEEDERKEVDRIIREELTFRDFKSKNYLVKLIEKYSNAVDGVILGCTEIPLVIKEKDVSIPVLDSATLHVRALIEEARK